MCCARRRTPWEAFSAHHRDVRHVGFTSPDRRLPGSEPDYRRAFHLAGRSTFKGTAALLAAWRAHPHWPTLTLVQHPDNAPGDVPPNVELVATHLDDDALRKLQNACGLHLCPSLAEGWGHYIVEAMSCGALVVTTDAPPMNELVSVERGLLVRAGDGKPRHLGQTFEVDPDALARTIDEALAASPNEASARAAAARAWFEHNDGEARSRLVAALESALDGRT